MKIYLCNQNLRLIQELLQAQLPSDEVLTCAANEVEAAAGDADVLIPTISRIGIEALAASGLKLVQQYGAGLDSVDLAAATKANVYVANVPTAGTGNAESVAELAVLLMLALARQFPKTQERLRQRAFGSPIGRALKGRTAAIIGYGGIGRELARRLHGFEMKVLAVSRTGAKNTVEEAAIPIAAHRDQAGLHDTLRAADFVILATPLNDDTQGLVGVAELACMKPDAFIINVARGPVIAYQPLLTALREGKIAGAGLDVFWYEPFDPNDPIFAYNVIGTPHVGGATDLSLRGIAATVVENINRVRHGGPPLNCINPHIPGKH